MNISWPVITGSQHPADPGATSRLPSQFHRHLQKLQAYLLGSNGHEF
jgi:hypothetical protein